MHHSEFGTMVWVFFPRKRNIYVIRNAAAETKSCACIYNIQLCCHFTNSYIQNLKQNKKVICNYVLGLDPRGGKGKSSTCRVLGHTHETKQNWHSYVTSLLNCRRYFNSTNIQPVELRTNRTPVKHSRCCFLF